MKPPHNTEAARPAPSPHLSLFDQLDAVLRSLLSEHEKLLTLAGEHARAISQADAAALSVALAGQSAAVGRITSLERQRQAIVARESSVCRESSPRRSALRPHNVPAHGQRA